MSKSVLEQLQEDVVARLGSLPLFKGVIPIFKLREQHIDSQLEQALTTIQAGASGKSGAAITVMMPLLDVPKGTSNVPGPVTQPSISVRVQEFPTINMASSGTGISAESMGIEVVQGLHHYGIDGIGTLYAHAEALTPSREFLPKITYIATLELKLSLQPLPKAAKPIVTQPVSGGAVHFEPAGWDFWYTTATVVSGLTPAFPYPNGPGATIYTLPDPVIAAGTILRAAAYPPFDGDPSVVGSDVTQVTLS